MPENYNILLEKINEFKHKFYLHRLIRGLIYSLGIILALYLISFVSIYYAHPSVVIKTSVFVLFVTVAASTGFYWILRPLLGYLRIGSTMSAEEAALFIGIHFTSVKDKLLNTLQLHTLARLSQENNALILAGIDQKIVELRPVPFTNAINLRDNNKYLKFLVTPLSIILIIGLISPVILREGSYSFIRFNQEILPKAPFSFLIKNKSLAVVQGDDLDLNLEIDGNQIPQDVYLEDGINTFKLDKKGITSFKYTVKNLQKDQKIWFSGGGFRSEVYLISVKPRPSVVNVNVDIVYPGYLHKEKETISNAGDLILPEGAQVNWSLNSENSSTIAFFLGSRRQLLTVVDNKSKFNAQLRNNTRYKITARNESVLNKDSISHQILIIKDQYPSIAVKETADSLSNKVLYFSGSTSDDHGFSALYFRFNVLRDGKKIRAYSQAVPIKKETSEASFFYAWLLNKTELNPGEVLEYYFEVSDNDAVNGPKTSRSAVNILQVPTQQDISDKIDSGAEKLKQKMEDAIKLAESVEKDSKKLAESLLDKKQISFEDKKQIESLLEKQQQLEAAVKDIKTQNEKNNFDKEENTALKKELAEKQQQIDNLFKNVLDDKTKEFLKQLQKLMQENSKEQTQDQLSKMQMDNKSLKKELDRILELYKQLEFEQSLQFSVDRLQELAKRQQSLSEESKNKGGDSKELESKQKELSQDFNLLKKEFEKIENKDQALERPNGFKAPIKTSKDISEQQMKAQEALEGKNSKKAAESQKTASEQMENLANEIEASQQKGQEDENKVNARELRKLLEKLLSTSFEQEKTMLDLKRISPSDPMYITNVQKQRNIIDNMSIIGDSLFSLSKLVPQISSNVNEEMQKITLNMGKSLDNLGERRTADANKFQQYTMTSVNNLALMLNEALEQLQKMQKNGSAGKSGKRGMKQLQQMQEQLNKKMQNARDQLEKNGNNGTVPKGNMSEEFAKMAQQQQLIRDALQKINREDNKDGRGSLGNLNQLIDDMKRTELDLVNKKIAQETLNRQKNILTRLLDAENAQREQDQDGKREATTSKEFPPTYQKILEKYKKLELNSTESIQKVPASLQLYYKNIINEYYKKLGSNN